MNGAHTPGPWVKRSAILTGADGSYVVAAGLGLGLGSDNGDGVRAANARLIAAAPDLLDALKQIVECEKRRAADLRHREAWKLVKFSEGRIAQAEAAIAKATGAAQ